MSTPRSPPSRPSGHLRVTLLVTPAPGVGCAVLDAGSAGTVSMHKTRTLGDGRNDACSCTAEATTGSDVDPQPRLLEGDVTERCICPVFDDHDCVASIEGFEGDTLTVSVAIPDREELSTVIAALRERGATVRLSRISTSTAETGRRMLELDADDITEKQREAVRIAIEAGYYDTPRDADLADLAEALGISRSAVSQRLTAVESKLVAELVRADDGVAPGFSD